MYNFRSIAQRMIQNVQSLHRYTGLVLRILLGLKFSNDALQLPLSLTLREVAHFVVSWSDFHQPEGWEDTQNVCLVFSFFIAKHLPTTLKQIQCICMFQLTIRAWYQCRCGCSSWWSAQTHYREPTRACGPVRWKGATGPPGCPSPWDSGRCAPGEQPDNTRDAN